MSSRKSSPATLPVRFSSGLWTSWHLATVLSCPPPPASSPCRPPPVGDTISPQSQAWRWVSLRLPSRSLAHIQPVLGVTLERILCSSQEARVWPTPFLPSAELCPIVVACNIPRALDTLATFCVSSLLN